MCDQSVINQSVAWRLPCWGVDSWPESATVFRRSDVQQGTGGDLRYVLFKQDLFERFKHLATVDVAGAQLPSLPETLGRGRCKLVDPSLRKHP